MKKIIRFAVLNLGLAYVLTPVVLHAHCDTLQGPVVNSARTALKAGDVTPVLMWIKAEDEKTIREAFNRTLLVRKQSKEAADLADTWFFETLVRVHRAGEGAPFTGLKSETATEPGITAADRALASGKVEDVLADTVLPLQTVLKAKFNRVRLLQPHAVQSVAGGREFVAAYVDYVHFAEHIAILATPVTRPETEHLH